jgi:hypothetical protein
MEVVIVVMMVEIFNLAETTTNTLIYNITKNIASSDAINTQRRQTFAKSDKTPHSSQVFH